MLRVVVENVERIFYLLSKPNRKGFSDDVRAHYLGIATLEFPLEQVSITAISTGTEFEITARIETSEILIEDEKTKNIRKERDVFKLSMGVGAENHKTVFVGENCFRILDENDDEKYTVFLYRHGHPLMISAGLSRIPSAPAIKLTTPENLGKDLLLLAELIQNTVNSSYAVNYNVLQSMPDKQKETEFYKIFKESLNYAISQEMKLRICAPISSDEIFDTEKDDKKDGDNDEGEDRDDGPAQDRIGKVHRIIKPENIEHGLDDVAGIDEQKEQIIEILEFLKDPARFNKLGAEIPQAVLLSGPPGTGKTMLAQAIAKAAGVPFFMINGSSFVEVFVGVGAGRVRKLFGVARKKAPCIIFIDEIDAVAGGRGDGLNSEREQTVNQLLAEIEGFEKNVGVIVIVATNRPDILDKAIISRFGRRIKFDNPDIDAREAILKVQTKNKPIEEGINLRDIAKLIIGFSGRDIKNLLNEAALSAVRQGKEAISQGDIDKARERIMMGPEGKIKNRSREELIRTAYHEAGHAIVTEHLRPLSEPVYKVTIVPHGNAQGLMVPLPDERSSITKAQLLARMKVSMAGRAAEMILAGNKKDISTGASADIMNVSYYARKMVMEWGLSKLGHVFLGSVDTDANLGYAIARVEAISDQTREKIDNEMKDLAEKTFESAYNILVKLRADLDEVAHLLLRKETITGDEVRAIMKKNNPTEKDLNFIKKIEDEEDDGGEGE